MTSRKHKQKRTLHFCKVLLGAANQIRTGDLVLTKDVLCLLSHSSLLICGHRWLLIYYIKLSGGCQHFFRKFFIFFSRSLKTRIITWVLRDLNSTLYSNQQENWLYFLEIDRKNSPNPSGSLYLPPPPSARCQTHFSLPWNKMNQTTE